MMEYTYIMEYIYYVCLYIYIYIYTHTHTHNGMLLNHKNSGMMSFAAV